MTSFCIRIGLFRVFLTAKWNVLLLDSLEEGWCLRDLCLVLLSLVVLGIVFTCVLYDGDSSYPFFSVCFYLLPSMVEHCWWANLSSCIFGLKDGPAWWGWSCCWDSPLCVVVFFLLFLFSLFTTIYTQASGMSPTTFRLYKFCLCVGATHSSVNSWQVSVWDWFGGTNNSSRVHPGSNVQDCHTLSPKF